MTSEQERPFHLHNPVMQVEGGPLRFGLGQDLVFCQREFRERPNAKNATQTNLVSRPRCPAQRANLNETKRHSGHPGKVEEQFSGLSAYVANQERHCNRRLQQIERSIKSVAKPAT